MATKHTINIDDICMFFEGNIRFLKRGRNSYNSGNVQSMTFDKALRTMRGKVQASMKHKTYNVEVIFGQDFEILSATCNCPRGQVICHHMAALLCFGHDNVSVTDKECSWSTKTASKDTEVKTCSELYPLKEPYDPPVKATAASNLLQDLEVFGGAVGFTWLLKPEPSIQALDLPDVEELVLSEEFTNADNKRVYLEETLQLSEEKIQTINNLTIGQSANENWLLARKNRLTASNFGVILRACRRKKTTPSLLKTLTDSYSLEGIKSIQWGRENEKYALEWASQVIGKPINKCGLFLHPCGFLGASPDGIVDDAIIEVKCPFKFRSASLEEGFKHDKTYILYYENDLLVLNKNHIYYDQIQGQLHLSGRTLCYLVIWSPNGKVLYEINKDCDWGENIDVLIDFYFNSYIPHLSGIKTNN